MKLGLAINESVLSVIFSILHSTATAEFRSYIRLNIIISTTRLATYHHKNSHDNHGDMATVSKLILSISIILFYHIRYKKLLPIHIEPRAGNTYHIHIA